MPARALLWGLGLYAAIWLLAAILWTSYDAVPGSIIILGPAALIGAFLAGWYQTDSPRTSVVIATWTGVAAGALGTVLIAIAAGASWMPVEPITLALFLLYASPALLVATASAHAWRSRRTPT